MFEILKALRDANVAAMAHGTRLAWEVKDEGYGPVLKAEIPLDDDDARFIENMRELLAEA